MIDLRLMYELYVKHLNFSIAQLLTDNESYIQSVDGVRELIVDNTIAIDRYCTVKTKTILAATSIKGMKDIKFPSYPVYDDGREVNCNALLMYIQKYIHFNSKVNTVNIKVRALKKQILPYTVYKAVITGFNKRIASKIVNNNYEFNLIPSFGSISVVRTESLKKKVNWGASDKKKAEILAKGGIPYLKAEAENTPNYKGEKWLVYHPLINFYFYWKKYKKYRAYVKDFTYKPARGKVSIVKQLQNVKDNRELALSLYTRTKHYE